MNPQDKAKQRVHWMVEDLQKGNFQGYENRLTELVLDYEERLEVLSTNTPRNTDISALIQEMRNGFEAMDRRFGAVDKRFESMDKRFDDLIHQMDKRFSAIQWFMGMGFSFLALILTYGTFFQ